uniref:Uncharacterized protein n=1 Tax=Brassica campestris TaxID=3711 RepID=A0A3P6BLD8_BRACM|nr:unnamed protein product [Brassica rapa]
MRSTTLTQPNQKTNPSAHTPQLATAHAATNALTSTETSAQLVRNIACIPSDQRRERSTRDRARRSTSSSKR